MKILRHEIISSQATMGMAEGSEHSYVPTRPVDEMTKSALQPVKGLKIYAELIRNYKKLVIKNQAITNCQNSYGQEVSPFFNMGGTPTATDANYNREVYQVKYLGTQGQVQHNLTLIQAAHGPVIARR